MIQTNDVYKRAHNDNEADANKCMSYVNAAAGILAMIMWVLYITRVFTIPDHFFIAVLIMFPLIAVLMFVPIFLVKTECIRKPWYKYFILFSMLLVIIALNIALPKHSLLFWPFPVLIVTHYYNPTIGKVVFAVSIISMFLCLYLGMLFGEFDENLFGGGVIKPDGSIGTVETLQERLDLLHQRILEGDNRYVKVLVYYFFPRVAIITLFSMVSNLLNKRTYKLLDQEIRVHDEQQKAKTELNVAKEIQLNTLPADKVFTDDVEIVGELKAAKEVGGDLYDYLDIDENHVAVLIGDVSGKGVPAAMFMMKTITSFRGYAKANRKPSEILKDINASVIQGNKASMFVTCFLAILDKRNGKLVYCNAGHNHPVIGSNRKYRYLDCKSGFLLGCFKDLNLVDEETELKPGESIILYTDGITEARNESGDFFKEDRLLDVCNGKDYTCLFELHSTIKDAVADFVKDAPQSDDITFVTLQYRGERYSLEDKFFNDTKKENILEMLDFLEDFGTKYNFPDDFKNKIQVVGDELFSNIIKYGYDNKGGEIYVRQLFNEVHNEYVLTIVDRAKPFNPLEVEEKEVDPEAKKQATGGLGILIVKKIMNDATYEYINGKNILVLRKTFEK